MTNFNAIPTQAITCHNGELTTTSLKVAEAFGKKHKYVLRMLRSLHCSDTFASAHFRRVEASTHKGSATKSSKVYEMTKDGFMFLVTGYVGKQAAAIKEAYILEFNRMAKGQQLTEAGKLTKQIVQSVLDISYCRNQNPRDLCLMTFQKLRDRQEELVEKYLKVVEK